MGAERAEAHPLSDIEETGQDDWTVPSDAYDQPAPIGFVPAQREPEAPPTNYFGPFLVALAVLWTAASAWWAFRQAPLLTLPVLIQWIATLSGPLIMIGVAWIVFGRTPRRETESFTRALAEMRRESAELERMLILVNSRLEQNHSKLTDGAAKLMALGDEASDRLGRVAHYLSKETANLDKRTASLEGAAATARSDIGVLLTDLPRAEEQARAISESMKEAGLTAHSQAGSLEAQVSALLARGREADEVIGGAAQRLGAHLARIESTSETATTRMQEASTSMTAVIDGSMERASEAIEAARTSLETQGSAMLAMIEQSRAALDRAGEDAVRNLSQRLDSFGGKIESLAAKLAAQDAASHAMVNGLAQELAELDERFTAIGQSGAGNSERLNGAIAEVQGNLQQLLSDFDGGQERATELTERARELSLSLGSISGQLQEDIPGALDRVEEQAERTRATASAIVPNVEAIQASAEGAAAKLDEAEASVSRQQQALEAMLVKLSSGVGEAQEQLVALGQAVTEADVAASRIVTATGPELVEALVRVRETANQAAERARDAIAAVIPHSAAALGEASRQAMATAVVGQVQEQMEEMSAVAERAVEAARKASERLTRQMLTITETTVAIEERIDEVRKEREAKESENFSRRTALLIESLNSTAIDVTKILSNEVTDSAWAAYLKGDRGVFTRRAVKLLDANEGREIMQHYEAEPEFRDQVNRYIHDFEAMLRRILADRDSSALGVTILSSDMGKLYVALAQAIERIRA